MLRLLTTILSALALCAFTFAATDAFARGGGHGGGGGGFRGGGGFHGGGGYRGGGGFRGGGVAFRGGAVAFRGGAVHVGGFRGGAVRVGGFRVAPRRFFVGAPIVVGYPYYYGDPYLDYPADQQCVVQRRLVQTVYGAEWRPVTVCDY